MQLKVTQSWFWCSGLLCAGLVASATVIPNVHQEGESSLVNMMRAPAIIAQALSLIAKSIGSHPAIVSVPDDVIMQGVMLSGDDSITLNSEDGPNDGEGEEEAPLLHLQSNRDPLYDLLLQKATSSVVDQHLTTVELLPSKPGDADNHFVLDVRRVDNLVRDESSLIGRRIFHAYLSFEVDENGTVFAGEYPVPVGLSNMEVKVQMEQLTLPSTTPFSQSIFGMAEEEGEEGNEDHVQRQFDIGIVGIKVGVFKESNQGVERITIIEQVLEVNGYAFEVTKAMQQIIYIHPGGLIERQKPQAADPLHASKGVANGWSGKLVADDTNPTDKDDSFLLKHRVFVYCVLAGVVLVLFGSTAMWMAIRHGRLVRSSGMNDEDSVTLLPPASTASVCPTESEKGDASSLFIPIFANNGYHSLNSNDPLPPYSGKGEEEHRGSE